MPSSKPVSVSRRSFVRTLGLAGAAVATTPWLRGGMTRTDRALILIHLAGGHDGLSTFVPAQDDDYYRARPTLALRREALLRVGERAWLNRAAADLAPLLADGQLAVLPAVGFDAAVPSHYRAAQLWRTGTASEEVATSPWYARAGVAARDCGTDFAAAPESLVAAVGEGARVVTARCEGFDTHFDQRVPYDAALASFARGLAQLQRQLVRRGLADRVLTVAYSEFGRTVHENAFGGTDHGHGGQVYFAGGSVRGGVHGELRADVAASVDPRRVIATCAHWLGCADVSAARPLPIVP
jgi:uncharacterized protein (DUF1501 family)